jgi:predicted MFS family arabinose efflux permease
MIGSILFPAPLVLFPLAGGPTWAVVGMLIAGEFLSSVGVMLFDVNLNSLSVLTTPHRLRSRVAGVGRFVNYGTRPIGAVVGGALGEAIGLRPTLWVGVLGACLCILWLLPSPFPRLREAPVEAA